MIDIGMVENQESLRDYFFNAIKCDNKYFTSKFLGELVNLEQDLEDRPEDRKEEKLEFKHFRWPDLYIIPEGSNTNSHDIKNDLFNLCIHELNNQIESGKYTHFYLRSFSLESYRRLEDDFKVVKIFVRGSLGRKK